MGCWCYQLQYSPRRRRLQADDLRRTRGRTPSSTPPVSCRPVNPDTSLSDRPRSIGEEHISCRAETLVAPTHPFAFRSAAQPPAPRRKDIGWGPPSRPSSRPALLPASRPVLPSWFPPIGLPTSARCPKSPVSARVRIRRWNTSSSFLQPRSRPQTISFDAADALWFESAARGGNIIFAEHGPTNFELFDGSSGNDGAAGKLSPLPTRARSARHWAGVIRVRVISSWLRWPSLCRWSPRSNGHTPAGEPRHPVIRRWHEGR